MVIGLEDCVCFKSHLDKIFRIIMFRMGSSDVGCFKRVSYLAFVHVGLALSPVVTLL